MYDNNCNGLLYIIKEGDTLYNISRRYNVPLTLIMRANQYVDIYNLQIGSEICLPVEIPTNSREVRTYIISNTDTIQQILDKFGITYEELLRYNNIQNVDLRPGMAISIPSPVPIESIELDEEDVETTDDVF